jgi:carboxyl-terminal processing protease
MDVPFAKRFGSIILAAIVIAGVFTYGVYFGAHRTSARTEILASVANNDTTGKTTADFAPFWEAWQILGEKFVATHGQSTTTDQDKVWGAIKGLAESYGDPYTTFFPPQEAKDFQEQISGNFEGVGMEVDVKDNVVTVVAPLKGSPAYKAGIKPGDKILKIDNTITANMSADEAVKLIRGKKGTKVTLTLLSDKAKDTHEVSLTRDVIDIPTIDSEMRKDGVYVIHLYNFSANSPKLFMNALQEFINSHTDKLVLDLRGNPGGYLDAAVDMASWFLPKDAVVVKEDTAGHGADTVYKSKGYNVFNKSLKMVVLVDAGSASASEILAGALSEQGVAKLVGQTTFGKGSVQELVPLTSNTSLKVTVARWLTPNGKSISAEGLKPDVEVKVNPDNAAKGVDEQLEKAASILLGK